MKKIIEIKNLSFEYREGIRTINNISFDIFEGEYVAILGHNGSGKSTIAKLIIGLLEKLKGTIIVNGVELTLENLYKVRAYRTCPAAGRWCGAHALPPRGPAGSNRRAGQ